jgi:DNA-binding NarL/FixJ family response regulator
MVTGGIRIKNMGIRMIMIDIRWYQEKALAKYNLYSSNFKIMSSSDYTERERQVLKLYDQGKTTLDIAKEQRLSLRDISLILKKHGVNHGITSIDGDDDDNKKSHSNTEKATQAYKLFSEGKKPVQVAIELNQRKTSRQVVQRVLEVKELK